MEERRKELEDEKRTLQATVLTWSHLEVNVG